MLSRLFFLPRRHPSEAPLAPLPAGGPGGKPEAAVLLRHLADVQQRCSDLAQAQARRIQHLEGLARHLQQELLQRDAELRALRERHATDDEQRAADEVICRTGCVSHNYYWRSDGHCQRKDDSCHHAVADAAVEEDVR